jgi:hypothetical protein
MSYDPYAEPRTDRLDLAWSGYREQGYEIESEAWYRAVAEGRELPTSDRSYLARTRTNREVSVIYVQGCFT